MHTDNHKVSLVICTKDRKPALKQLVSSILTTINLSKVRIFIIDQSQHAYAGLSRKMYYIHTAKTVGLSLARNTALDACKTPIIAFTDDDCIMTKQYADALGRVATKKLSNTTALIFGRTAAYEKSVHKNLYCPCTFSKTDRSDIHTIVPHWSQAGYGNNMLVQKETVMSIGGFKPWLGSGSIGESAEDAEYTLRCLIAGYKIAYDPALLIFHNRWLTTSELRTQSLKYSCGGLAAYGFYYFQGVKECGPMLTDHVMEIAERIQNDLRSVRSKPMTGWHHFVMISREVYSLFKGLALAFVFARIIPIPDKENVVKRYYRP